MSFIITKESVFKIADVIYLIVVFMAVLFVVSVNVSREIKIGNVEANTLVKKALYSGSCFAYQDARVRPLILDIKRFNNKVINGCITNERFSGRFRLFLENGTIVDAMNNENRFLVDKKLCSYSGYNCFEIRKPVLVYDNGLKRGVLEVDATIKEA